MTTPSGPPDYQDVCAAHPWVREAWLLDVSASRDRPAEGRELLVVCDVPPNSVTPGQRHRLHGEMETATGHPLELRLVSARQLSGWLSKEARFAAAFRHAERLYP